MIALALAVCSQPVVLVTIDGVRPDEVWSPSGPDLLPNLHRLAARGMAWPEARASGPVFMSLPGYHEIITGRPRDDDDPTLLDELSSAHVPVAVVASWDWIARVAARDLSAFSFSAGQHGGDPFPGVDDYRPDRDTAPLALATLQTLRPCFFWVSLGDTDEYAHRGDHPSYLEALRDFDRFLGDLDATLAAMHTDPVIVVTSDHGRDLTFRDHGVSAESSRTWIVVGGGPIAPATASYIPSLCQIAPFVRRLLHLPRDPAACAPLIETID